MAYCSICEADGKKVPAAMFCANCGKPICAAHAVHGRYCSEACFREHQFRDAGKAEEKPHSQRKSNWAFVAAAIFAIAFAAAYLILSYLGV